VGLEPTLVGLGDQVVVDAERLQVHDAETLRPLLDIGAEMQPERGTARLTQAVSRDDLAVLAFDDGRLGLLRKDQGWDWLIPGPSKPHITHLALSPAPGTGILATTADQKGLIFSEDGQTTLNFEVAPAAAWTETGDQWAWALADGGVAVRSLVRDESGRDVAQGLDVSHLHWLDRKRLLMASDTRLVEWDVETDTPGRVWVERNTPILNLWARPLEVSLSTTEDLLTLDVATGQRLATIPLRGSAAGTFVHWTDRGLLVTEDGVPGLRILDPRGGDIARELAFSSRATSALQMPDQLLVGTTDGILHRLGEPPAIQTNLRACRNGRVVAILPFPPLDRLMEPDACGMNTAPP
jgi:hypothetical protein